MGKGQTSPWKRRVAYVLPRRVRARARLLGLVAMAVFNVPATGASGPDGFAAGPYLLEVRTNAATVVFHLRDPMPAEVLVFDGAAMLRFNSPAGRSHYVRVAGLAPSRTYRYEVVCGDGAVRTPAGDDSYQITTACLPGESFSFVVYGDPRPGETQTHWHHEQIVARMLLHKPAFCLVLGDMVDDGGRAPLWEQFFAVESALLRQTALFPVFGDNDYSGGRGLLAEYFRPFSRGYYHFTWGGLHFFALHAWDTRGAQPESEFDASSAQTRWLEEQLSSPEAQQAPFRVVFLHDPVIICRGSASETLRRVWGELFRKYRVDLVFASWHLYERSLHDGITYIISGGAGAELLWSNRNPEFPSQVDAQRHHFCLVDVREGALRLRAVADDGTVLDHLTLLPRGGEGPAATALQHAARRLVREFQWSGGPAAPELTMLLFSTDCPYCRRLLQRDLPRWASERKVTLRVREYDLGLPGVYDLLMAAGADFGRQDAELPAVFVGRTVLGGEAEIKAGLPRELEAFRRDPQEYRRRAIQPFALPHDTGALRSRQFAALGFGTVVVAGLLDGLNPCAFTAIIFLVSYLGLVGGSRRQMLWTGGAFTLAVFLMYLVIGLLFFQFVRLALRSETLARLINLSLLVVLVALTVFSAVDVIRCLQGQVAKMILQLPGSMKADIRRRIRAFARRQRAMVGAAFLLGVVIAGLELACTGQVYLPIVTMISEPSYRGAAFFKLLVYNLAFSLPLALVLLLAVFGMTSQRMAALYARHVVMVKIGLTLLFAGLAGMVLFNLGWI